ncbi:glyoxalase-like protein [Prauserella sp. PE36]|uniref:bleomycin resistance protein n=1 Tax=Prauserella sp. PE36 TaxID=1504709 RepID=UPI000DE2A76C|nr:VOC family protein [Prauserella sp. PE36]RBM19206.1 glyoxalase-like protein [Prauserella sp. PE36]
MDEVRFEDITPIVPVRDLAAALERYRLLGFTVEQADTDADYGFANRGEVWLHLTEWAEHDPKRTGAAVYVYVSDADAVHTEWSASGVGGRFTAPQDTPYGLREFAYVDPEGTLHRIGSPLAG